MARAQMEIMGLAVIVILAAIGLFYMVAFNTGTPDLPAVEFRASEQAQNTILAMLNTDISGCGTTLENTIADYATYRNLPCLRSAPIDKIKDESEKMLESTLGEWGRKYTLNITIPGEAAPIVTIDSDNRCTGAYETGNQPIPLYPAPGNAYMILIVCV